MSTSESNIQSAAERRAAETALSDFVAKYAPDHKRLLGVVRRALRKRLPTAHELVYEYKSWIAISYSPNEHGYEGVLAIRADADGVDLYFNRGKGLPDPEKLLRGSARLVRFIHLEGVVTLKRPAVAALIDEAIARAPVPFARTRAGPIVIRSSSAKKAARRRPTATGQQKRGVPGNADE